MWYLRFRESAINNMLPKSLRFMNLKPPELKFKITTSLDLRLHFASDISNLNWNGFHLF